MSKWHVREIKKGVFGELSKVQEELEEALDAQEQNQPVMLLFELTDIIGAVAGVAAKHGLSIDDLVAFSKLRTAVLLGDKKEDQKSGFIAGSPAKFVR